MMEWAQFVLILVALMGGSGAIYSRLSHTERKLDDILANMVDKHTFLHHNHVGLENGRIVLED